MFCVRFRVMWAKSWRKPLIFESRGRLVCLRSPEEAISWLLEDCPNQYTNSWQHAWKTCQAVYEGRLPSQEARSAVLLAAESIQ